MDIFWLLLILYGIANTGILITTYADAVKYGQLDWRTVLQFIAEATNMLFDFLWIYFIISYFTQTLISPLQYDATSVFTYVPPIIIILLTLIVVVLLVYNLAKHRKRIAQLSTLVLIPALLLYILRPVRIDYIIGLLVMVTIYTLILYGVGETRTAILIQLAYLTPLLTIILINTHLRNFLFYGLLIAFLTALLGVVIYKEEQLEAPPFKE